jgi:hypothetical protein
MTTEFGIILSVSSWRESALVTMIFVLRLDAGLFWDSKAAGISSNRMIDMNFVKFKGVLYLKNAAF